MLTRLIARVDAVSESIAAYNAADEYVYRDAEYEYEHEEQPEPRVGRGGLESVFGLWLLVRSAPVNPTVLPRR